MQAEAKRVEPHGGGVRLTIEVDGRSRAIEGSHFLVATGRTPNSDALNLQSAGVALGDKGHIAVSDRFETNVEGVYACGDVTGGPMFTHVSHNDNQILRENFLRGRRPH